jgi:hypothetical protein
MRKNCTSCIHYTICSNNDLILDPLHGGVPCKDYDSIDNYIPKENPVEEKDKGFWFFNYVIDNEGLFPIKSVCRTCSVCRDKRMTPFASEFCPKCGSMMSTNKPEKILEEI